ncbi:hypothetical protein SO802_003914 [Lithocarpus litseifolius]|uniref:Uncharacterized protein n=1 Tax=Lithocarpus litseifolius TaxID=425828 RepID=A0AAW2E1F3_9ROSI
MKKMVALVGKSRSCSCRNSQAFSLKKIKLDTNCTLLKLVYLVMVLADIIVHSLSGFRQTRGDRKLKLNSDSVSYPPIPSREHGEDEKAEMKFYNTMAIVTSAL